MGRLSLSAPKQRPLFGVLCAVGWSLAYPLIKLGYRLCGIGGDLGSAVLFAGIRFTLAGLLVLAFGGATGRDLRVKKASDGGWLLLFAAVNTFGHYLFAYIGLTYLPGARSTVLDSMGCFLLILLSSLLYKEDRFTVRKGIGCAVGLLGIGLINAAPAGAFFEGISFAGDGCLLLNACCATAGGILTRKLSQRIDMTAATGYGMLTGGLLLLAAAPIFGIRAKWTLSPAFFCILLALALISAVCFEIYNLLLKHHPIGKVAVFNALIPVLGVVFSSLLLWEPFRPRYFLAGLCAAAGVYLVNRSGEKRWDRS